MSEKSYSSSLRVTGQFPLDAKAYFPTLEALADLGIDDANAFTYFDSQVVVCQENKKQYIWKEANSFTTSGASGVLPNGFTYPAGSVVNEVDYSGKIYNWFEYKPVNQPTPAPILPNEIISGNVYWSGTGLTFMTTDMSYRINGVVYNIQASSLSLGAADPGDPRIDLLVLTTDGLLDVVPGTPAATPQEPTPNYETQLRATAVLVPAGATEPSQAQDVQVYDENAGFPSEWDASIATLGGGSTPNDILLGSLADPSKGTVCIEGTNVPDTTYLSFVGAAESLDVFSSLYFEIKSKFAMSRDIVISLYNSGQQIASYQLQPGVNGYQPNDASVYSKVNIPQADFAFNSRTATEFDEIRFVFLTPVVVVKDPNIGFYMDNVKLILGQPDTPGAGNTFLELDDVDPSSYSGQGGKAVVVRPDESGLEFGDAGSLPIIYGQDFSTNESFLGGSINQISLPSVAASNAALLDTNANSIECNRTGVLRISCTLTYDISATLNVHVWVKRTNGLVADIAGTNRRHTMVDTQSQDIHLYEWFIPVTSGETYGLYIKPTSGITLASYSGDIGGAPTPSVPRISLIAQYIT